MAITRETVLHVARLARLDLDESEVERMKRDLNSILEYVDELSSVDTSAIAETAHISLESAVLRPDLSKPGVATELALSEAPRGSGSSFAVPAFVEET
ncbi:MAG TPA: Asp-tRNA(Asn)/Glu-tRNA(Gln) amidotransferase subunit GatC [Polyangiaceae bacterium]|nr:Asp-tRNA(Asn)/Glu-tRNA(Gln) amidotransferase subunit GatC [Polyangiaceae bacterium]